MPHVFCRNTKFLRAFKYHDSTTAASQSPTVAPVEIPAPNWKPDTEYRLLLVPTFPSLFFDVLTPGCQPFCVVSALETLPISGQLLHWRMLSQHCAVPRGGFRKSPSSSCCQNSIAELHTRAALAVSQLEWSKP